MAVVVARRFKKDDFFPVMKLIYKIFPERYDPFLIINLSEVFSDGFIVAEENNKIVGFIIGVKTSEETARILLLGVEEKHRDKGVGSLLLNRFIREMILNGSRYVQLEVRMGNKKAINFYKKHGFHITQILPRLYRNGEDGYLMERRL
ncbi:MAG: ribosomal-protein-alanine acetyltransferase [Thermoplasmata archaeon]|nr:MAG: ribosomal-protein-alanine acetyltransferase [Thermoplasmata archaeon]